MPLKTSLSTVNPQLFNMDADRAIAIIERILAPKALNHVQIEIVRGVIAGSSYQAIVADATVDVVTTIPERESGSAGSIVKSRSDDPEPIQMERYKLSYVKDTAAQLWQTLSCKLGKRVTKKSLAAVLFWYGKQLGFELTDRRELTAIDLMPRSPAIPAIEGGFYGRTEEIAILSDWCLVEGSRLIFLLGLGGMGKTTLVGEVFDRLGGKFDRQIWRSLVNIPSMSEFCIDIIRLLQPQLSVLPDTVEGQIELFIACLKQNHCLLVVDNVESILEGQVPCGQYLPDYSDYDRLFRAIGELPHQSCAILTSREKPHTIARLQIVSPQSVRSMIIEGMNTISAAQLVQAYGCPTLPPKMWQEIHAHYDGNPLALKIATIAAVEMTGGGEKMLELYPLMKQGKLQFQNIDDILARQFDRLSAMEQQLVYWLAISRAPMTGSQLRSKLVRHAHAPGETINALQSLSRRCIIACQDVPPIESLRGVKQLPQRKWSIQPVTLAYVTTRLIDRLVAELAPDVLTNVPTSDLADRFVHLNTYPIVQPQTTDRLRQIQLQSILYPTIDRLLTIWGNHADLEQYLHHISSLWQSLDPIPSGYLVDNTFNLLNRIKLIDN